MMLYHGTSEKHLKQILADGIMPNCLHKNHNWKHTVTANDKAVYLTNAYGLYFAHQATDEPWRLAVLEVDTSKLLVNRLCADEDAVEQAMRGRDTMPLWPMKRRTAHYRKRIEDYCWQESLKALGNCAYTGTVPTKAITRIAVVQPKTMHEMIWAGYDPTISLMNYAITGEKYRDTMRWLFEPDAVQQEITEVGAFRIPKYPFPKSRDGIVLFTPEQYVAALAEA